MIPLPDDSGTHLALHRKFLCWRQHLPPQSIASPWVLSFTFPLVPVIWMMFSRSKSSTWDRETRSPPQQQDSQIRVAGGQRPCPLYLQPTPCQVQLHGFQLHLGVTSLALHLLQVAGIGLKGVECAYSILAITVPR